jgi:hypothetical protein
MVNIPLRMSDATLTNVSMDKNKYSLFLNGRMSEEQFRAECAHIEHAFQHDAEFRSMAQQLEDGMVLLGQRGSNGKCVAFGCVSLLCCCLPFAMVHGKQQERAAVYRQRLATILEAECARMNSIYAPAWIRFELQSEVGLTTAGGRAVAFGMSYWVAITIAHPAAGQPAPRMIDIGAGAPMGTYQGGMATQSDYRGGAGHAAPAHQSMGNGYERF